MLKVYVRGRKRRVWSPGTIAASVGAHLLLLAGAVSAAGGDGKAQKPDEDVVIIWDEQKPPPPPRPIVVEDQDEPPPAPETPKAPPVRGDFVTPRPPETTPTEILPPDLSATPITADDVRAIGREGDVIGTPTPEPTPPSGNDVPDGNGEGTPLDIAAVEERPELSNRSAAERLLRQNYPVLLRDAGVTGRTIVTMVIDAEGRVEPGSVRVVESSHEAFSDPAVKVAERMRFRPAKLNRQAVPVLITLPIEWKIER